MKQRLAWLDLAGGIMTILVLYYHACFPIFDGKILSNIPWLYFFMPWFFYKAGLMFTPKAPKSEWSNGLKKLIYTYFIWSAIGYVAHILMHWHTGSLTPRVAFYSPLRSFLLNASIPLDGAIWFLPILFLVRIIGNYLLQKVHPLWIIAISLFLSVLFRCVHIPFLPTWISATAWGLFFFSVGYYLKERETSWWIVGVSIILTIASFFTDIPIVYGEPTPLWCRLLWLPSCAFACVLFDNICRWLMRLVESIHIKHPFPLLSYVGRNAMSFYVPHYIIFRVVFDLVAEYNDAWYSGWQGLLIVTFAYFTILPCVSFIRKKLN